MNTLDYILNKFNLSFDNKTPMPIEIPNVGRNNLAALLHELDFKTGAEIGAGEGKYSQILLEANPRMELYGVEPWTPYEGYTDFTEKSIFKTSRENAKKRLSSSSNYEFIEEFSMNAVKKFQDESLDFVYIDANHEDPYITQDITEWSKKVRSGGIISGHDFKDVSVMSKDFEIRWKVKEAVMNHVASNNIKCFFVWGLYAKVPGMIRDISRSWMIIKP